MDQNEVEMEKFKRRIYDKEMMYSLRNSALSQRWPHSLDTCCINSHGQWDPVKSFDGPKASDAKRGNFYETKTYRNNDRNKDDISLRPERRKWNDGCQVSNNKRNGEDGHTNSYRKSYQGAPSNSGSGDYDRRSFNRNTNRNIKLRDGDKDNRVNNNIKSEKHVKSNSNTDEHNEEHKDEKDEHIFNFTSCINTDNEPEWFSNGPENCDEIIELRGITAHDSPIVHFKKGFSESNIKEEHRNGIVKETEDTFTTFTEDSPIFVDTCVTSPKREGSRFQDIFQKETNNNNLKESKDVENILKAVLSDTVSKSDAEKLNSVSKPLPNGVLTVEEIEKGITSTFIDFKRPTSKSNTLDTLTSFEPSLNSILSSGVSSPNVDNSKVVNWLSNLNTNVKEPEMDHKPLYPESQSFAPMNNMMSSQSMFTPVGYSKFPPNLQHPPGLPLMLNSCNLQQQHQLLQQQHLSIQQAQLLQSIQNQKQLAYMKQFGMPPSNSVNMTPRNPLLSGLQHDGFVQEKYKLNSQHGLPNDMQLDQNLLSNLLLKNNMNHINDRSSLVAKNAPPGLMSTAMSRPIVKTNSPFMDFAQMNDPGNHQYQGVYRRTVNPNSGNGGRDMYPPDMMNKFPPGSGVGPQLAALDMFKNMRSRDQHNSGAILPHNMLMNNYPTQGPQQPPPSMMMMSSSSNYDAVAQRSSSNKMLANLFNVNSSYLPPLPHQAKYADQIETENV